MTVAAAAAASESYGCTGSTASAKTPVAKRQIVDRKKTLRETEREAGVFPRKDLAMSSGFLLQPCMAMDCCYLYRRPCLDLCDAGHGRVV